MNEIVQTPVHALSKRSLGELVATGRRAIEEAGSFDEVKSIAAQAEALRAFQRSIGASGEAINAAAEIKVRAERRMGEALASREPAKRGVKPAELDTGVVSNSPPTLAEIGVTLNQSSRWQALAAIPADAFDAALQAHQNVEEPISASSVARVAETLGALPAAAKEELVDAAERETLKSAKNIRTRNSAARKAANDELKSKVVDQPQTGRHSVIVIDPPWDMKKIERDVRPNQVAFDYPTMTEAELAAFDVPGMADEDCHIFCWTTQRFLPPALRLIEAWSFKYVLTMVWHKSGGFQPIGLPQYNCEFVVYGRRGSPRFADTKAFPCCFEAPRREHSRKPDEFYDLIRRVTDGQRIDVFSRELREGFEQFGNETAKFGDAA